MVIARTQLGRKLPNLPTPKGWKDRVGPQRAPENAASFGFEPGTLRSLDLTANHSAIADRMLQRVCDLKTLAPLGDSSHWSTGGVGAEASHNSEREIDGVA
jgi:hypothetical protein